MTEQVDVQKLKSMQRPRGIPFQITKIGHVVLNCVDIERSVRFYTDVLGFSVSDVYPETMARGGMVFMRYSSDHHGVALVGILPEQSGSIELNHLAFQVGTLDEIFTARDHLKAHEDLTRALGGPVDRERGFVIHTADYATDDSTLAVNEALSLTPTREVLEAMADADRRPRHSILALGCATWGAGQLEEEIRQNVWLACDADESLVFDEQHETKWARALAKIGVRADHLSAQAGSA